MSEPDYELLYKKSLCDIERLNSILADLQKNLQASLDGNKELRQQLSELQAKLDILIAKKKNRDRKDFGSKSEGHNPKPAPADVQPRPKRLRNDQEPEPHPSALDGNADEVVSHMVPSADRTCPHCNIETQLVGNAVTRQLESVLRSLKIIEHHQETRACPRCKTYIKKAPKPESPIPGSYAGPNLLATIVCNKVEDGLPNYRQQKRFARESMPIPRSTQCDWFIAMSLTVEPLYELIKNEILKSAIIQTDETMIKVQDRKHPKNVRKGKMIVCRGDQAHELVCFLYSRKLSFEANKEYFRGYCGTIQADAATGFDALFEQDANGNGATEAGCNAHGRRKIFESQAMDVPIANQMLDIYERIYDIERKTRTSPPEVRLAMRRRYSKPLMRELRSLHEANIRMFAPSHLLVAAANYALNHWKALTLFLKNPAVAVDNNASEREIKAFVLARKNFLFAGSDAGAKALAVHFTLIASAKRNRLNPMEYLADVFARINQTKVTELDQLLPTRWKKSST